MQALPPPKPLLPVRAPTPASAPPQSIRLPQLTTHSPNRFPSQAPTSRDPFLACPGRLLPGANSKARLMDKGLLAVVLPAVGIQYSLSAQPPPPPLLPDVHQARAHSGGDN